MQFRSCVGGAIIFLDLYLIVDMTSHFAGCFSVSLRCLSTLLKSPVVIRSSHSHLAVISGSSQSHLTVISEPSRSHLAVISEPSHSHLAVLSHSSHKNQVQSRINLTLSIYCYQTYNKSYCRYELVLL